jgi:hypothetical protein
MAHIRNDEFYLYTGLTANGNECFEAYSILQNSGIQFRHLHYGDPSQHTSVIDNIKTWFPDREEDITMPFVTYVNVYEFQDPVQRIAVVVTGIEEIRNANWQELFNYTP